MLGTSDLAIFHPFLIFILLKNANLVNLWSCAWQNDTVHTISLNQKALIIFRYPITPACGAKVKIMLMCLSLRLFAYQSQIFHQINSCEFNCSAPIIFYIHLDCVQLDKRLFFIYNKNNRCLAIWLIISSFWKPFFVSLERYC